MEKTSKNPFLMAMGALCVVAVIGFIALVLPAKGEVTTKTTTINKSVGTINKEISTLPGDGNVEVWTKNAEELRKRYRDQLQELMETDQSLGQWFDTLDDSTTYAVFMNTYDDQRGKLQEELLDKGVLLGSTRMEDNKLVETGQPGFNWIEKSNIIARTNEDERQAKEMLQKRFNICRAIVNAVTAGYDKSAAAGRPRRLLDVTFLEKFKFLPTTSGVNPEAIKNFHILIDHRRYAGFAAIGSGAFMEQELPFNGEDRPLPVVDPDAPAGGPADASASTPGPKEKRLGRTITVGFAVVMEYQHVPDLIRNLLQPSVEPKLNLSIVGLNIFVAEPNPAEKKETYVLKAGETREEVEKRFEERTANSPPPQVHVYVTCQVMDLDPAAVPPFLKP
jgi:hypothetical protein